jgi:hypothetical protein
MFRRKGVCDARSGGPGAKKAPPSLETLREGEWLERAFV